MTQDNDEILLTDDVIDPKVRAALASLISEVESANNSPERISINISIAIDLNGSEIESAEEILSPLEICRRAGGTAVTINNVTVCCPKDRRCP